MSSYEYEPEQPEVDVEKAFPGTAHNAHTGMAGPRIRKNAPGLFLVVKHIGGAHPHDEHYWCRQDQWNASKGRIIGRSDNPTGMARVQVNGNHIDPAQHGPIQHVNVADVGQHDKILNYNSGLGGMFRVQRVNPLTNKPFTKLVLPHQVRGDDKIFGYSNPTTRATTPVPLGRLGFNKQLKMVQTPSHLKPQAAVGPKRLYSPVMSPNKMANVPDADRETLAKLRPLTKKNMDERNALVVKNVKLRSQVYRQMWMETQQSDIPQPHETEKLANPVQYTRVKLLHDARTLAVGPTNLNTTPEKARGEALALSKHYLDRVASEPDMAQKVVENFDEFAHYFGSALATHTTTFNHANIILATNTLISGEGFRAIDKEGKATERQKVHDALHPTSDDRAALYTKLYNEQLKPPVEIMQAKLDVHRSVQAKLEAYEAQEAANIATAKASGGTKAVAQYKLTHQQQLESGGKVSPSRAGLLDVDAATSYDKILTEFNVAHYLFSKYYQTGALADRDAVLANLKGKKGNMADLVMTMRSPNQLGLSNSMDKQVGVSNAVFGALHSVSRYQYGFRDAVTFVMKRNVLTRPDVTIFPLNAATLVNPINTPDFWHSSRIETVDEAKGRVKRAVKNGLPANHPDHNPGLRQLGDPNLAKDSHDVVAGKSVLLNANDPETIRALALHACFAFKNVDHMLQKYVGDSDEAKRLRTSLGEDDDKVNHASWMTSKNFTSEKPNHLPEIHIPQSLSMGDVSHVIFSSKATHDAYMDAHDLTKDDTNDPLLYKVVHAEADPLRPDSNNVDDIVKTLSNDDFRQRNAAAKVDGVHLLPSNPVTKGADGAYAVNRSFAMQPGDSHSNVGSNPNGMSNELRDQDTSQSSFKGNWALRPPIFSPGEDPSQGHYTYALKLDSGQAINVDVNSDYDDATASKIGALVQGALNKIPLHLQDATTHIEINKSAGDLDARTYAGGKISFFGLSNISTSLVHHEVAHQIARKLFGGELTPGAQWAHAMEKDANMVSRYGNVHYAEDFAESFAAHMEAADAFAESFPHRSALMEKILDPNTQHSWEDDGEDRRQVVALHPQTHNGGYDLGRLSSPEYDDGTLHVLGAAERGMYNKVLGGKSFEEVKDAFGSGHGISQSGESIELHFGSKGLSHSLTVNNGSFWQDSVGSNRDVRLVIHSGGDPTSNASDVIHSAEITLRRNRYTNKVQAVIRVTGMIGGRGRDLQALNQRQVNHYTDSLARLGVSRFDIRVANTGLNRAAHPTQLPEAQVAPGVRQNIPGVPPGALAFDDSFHSPMAKMVAVRPAQRGTTGPAIDAAKIDEINKAFSDTTYQGLKHDTQLDVSNYQEWFNRHGKNTGLTPEHVAKAYEMDNCQLSLKIGFNGGSTELEGKYKDHQGNHVGEFERSISGDKAYNKYLALEESAHGSGIASKMYAQQEMLYNRMGITQVSVHANMNVGGYAWATKGFEAEPDDLGRLKARFHLRITNGIVQAAFDPQSQLSSSEYGDLIKGYRNQVDAMTSVKQLAGFRMIHPISHHELALQSSSGQEGAYYHVGKAILLGSDWHGNKQIANTLIKPGDHVSPKADPLPNRDAFNEMLESYGPPTLQHNTDFTMSPEHREEWEQVGEEYGHSLTPEHVAKSFELADHKLSMSLYHAMGGAFVVSGHYHKNSQLAGHFEREIDLDNDMVNNTLLKVEKGFQGTGIASKLYAQSEALYRKLGISTVNIHANLEVGGYAWATKGYQPEESDMEQLRDRFHDYLDTHLADQKGEFDPHNKLTDSEFSSFLSQHKDAIDNMTDVRELAAFSVKHPVTGDEWKVEPQSEGYIGSSAEKVNELVHVGKAILLGSDWHGSKNLDEEIKGVVRQKVDDSGLTPLDHLMRGITWHQKYGSYNNIPETMRNAAKEVYHTGQLSEKTEQHMKDTMGWSAQSNIKEAYQFAAATPGSAIYDGDMNRKHWSGITRNSQRFSADQQRTSGRWMDANTNAGLPPIPTQ
jgi:GNAT superfamily N-acetyltransferase